MELNWTNCGEKYLSDTPDPESGDVINRAAVLKAIESLKWQPLGLGNDNSVAFTYYYAIKAMKDAYKIPSITEIATSPCFAPYGFFGIYAHYSNARVRIYCLDGGDAVVPLLSIPEYKEESVATE